MPTILDKIVATKRAEIERAKAAVPETELRARLADAPPVRDFFAPLAAGGPIKLIAEVKKASPSAGVIRADFDPVAIAQIYEAHGATCISVLTDEPYFQGRLEYLTADPRGGRPARAAEGFHSRHVSTGRGPRGRGRCRAADRRVPGRLQFAEAVQRDVRAGHDAARGALRAGQPAARVRRRGDAHRRQQPQPAHVRGRPESHDSTARSACRTIACSWAKAASARTTTCCGWNRPASTRCSSANR